MPKRKHNNKEIDYISEQLKKLKKKLKRARKQEESSSSSEGESKNSTEDHVLLEELITESETCVDVPQTEQFSSESPNVTPVLENTETTSDIATTNLEHTSSEVVSKTVEDIGLDKEILDILGDAPANTIQYGPEIHKELASRLQHITTSGLTKEARKELQQKHLVPANAILLGAPALNAEIKATLSEILVNRDKAIESKQKLLASAISCLASATSQLLGAQDKNNELLKKLMDANKLLCDIQHSDSVTRRMFSTSALKKDVKTQIVNTKIDKFLFGESLPDTLKIAKAVSKSSAEIKSTYNNYNKKPQPSTSKNNLNMKSPAVPSRKPPVTTQKTRQPASHQNQPVKSSKTASQPPKTTNYRR